MGRDKRRSNSALLRGTIPLSRFVSSRPRDDMQNFTRQHRIFARHPFYRDPNIILMRACSCYFLHIPAPRQAVLLRTRSDWRDRFKEHAHTGDLPKTCGQFAAPFLVLLVRISTRVTFTPYARNRFDHTWLNRFLMSRSLQHDTR